MTHVSCGLSAIAQFSYCTGILQQLKERMKYSKSHYNHTFVAQSNVTIILITSNNCINYITTYTISEKYCSTIIQINVFSNKTDNSQ